MAPRISSAVSGAKGEYSNCSEVSRRLSLDLNLDSLRINA